MGIARWDPDQWDKYVSKTKGKSRAEIFTRHSIDKSLDPREITVRESCDSDLNPLSTPIIVAVDDTGSMGFLAEDLIRNGLGVLIEEIYARKPVTDPHVMCMAVGDAWFDRAPLQVTQFEADIRLADQLTKFWIEGGGGGNSCESYNLPWYFAATRTKCDAILKRNKKGYLFTVGDEPPPHVLLAQHARDIFGASLQRDLGTRDLLTMASQSWEIFHIMVEEGSFYRTAANRVRDEWRAYLGQRAIALSDHTNLAELIVSTIQVNEGEDAAKVAAAWSGSTAMVVRKSLAALTSGGTKSAKGVTLL